MAQEATPKSECEWLTKKQHWCSDGRYVRRGRVKVSHFALSSSNSSTSLLVRLQFVVKTLLCDREKQIT
jgi:hypothetical protein